MQHSVKIDGRPQYGHFRGGSLAAIEIENEQTLKSVRSANVQTGPVARVTCTISKLLVTVLMIRHREYTDRGHHLWREEETGFKFPASESPNNSDDRLGRVPPTRKTVTRID